MARKAKRVRCLAISLFLCSCNILVTKAEALPEVLSGSTTLADNIMSYYALSGSAVANTDWINTLYNSYGTSFGTVEEFAQQGYLVLNEAGMWEPTQQLGQMIEQAPAYTSLGLNEMFNVSAEEVAAGGGFAVASGGSILAGSLGSVASTGALTLFGGVTAAYWGGIALGTLVAHAIGLYSKPVYYGLDILTSEDLLDLIPDGGSVNTIHAWGQNANYKFYINNGGLIAKCHLDRISSDPQDGAVYFCGYYNGTNSVKTYSSYNPQNNSTTTYNVQPNASSSNLVSYQGYTDGFTVLDRNYNNNELKGMVENGTLKNKDRYSPDLIGDNGNLVGQKNGNNYSIPDVKPQIDPGTQAGKPLSLNDWLNFANSAQNNNNQTNPSGLNADLFDNILGRIIIPNPNPNPDPNPDPDPNPYPDPHPNPDPDNVPVPDYENPEQETQPDYDSETETVPDPENGKPWVTPNLLDKFPFCIPKDLMNMAKNFNSGTRQAPEIEWRFNPPNTPIDFTFHLDLEDFEAVAVLLRTLELALFVVGLAFATRYLIGAS